MQLNFSYDEEKDIDCLLLVGGGSTFQPGNRTKTYECLLAFTSEIDNRETVREFVRVFIKNNMIDPQGNIATIQKNWDSISDGFQKSAERVFGVSMTDAVTAYLTITRRYPYRLDKNYFYVSATNTNANAVAMHELWHFYTWRKFGREVESKIGAKTYGDIKEALTVLLNIECPALMGSEIDKGYPQHQELRSRIMDIWSKSKDIEEVWSKALLSI